MFITPTGVKFSLWYHGPKEWADVTRERLISLGCSTEYAVRVAADLAAAKLVEVN